MTVIGATTAAAYTALSARRLLPPQRHTHPGWPGRLDDVDHRAERDRHPAHRVVAPVRRWPAPGHANPPDHAGDARRIDPRAVAELVDDAQYAVIIDGNGGRFAAVVIELNFQRGDGTAIYPGFFR